MGGGLHYDNVMAMPPGMRNQVVAQVLAKISAQSGEENSPHPEEPCETCVRWEECCGVDEECPRR